MPPRNFTDPEWRRQTTPRHVFFAIREGLAGTPMPKDEALAPNPPLGAMIDYALAAAGSEVKLVDLPALSSATNHNGMDERARVLVVVKEGRFRLLPQ